MFEILIADEICNELVETVRSQIDGCIANGAQKITFKINSGGGSVVSGLALYDLISAINSVETEAYIYGVCASAATYPALACDKVVMLPMGTFMIHPCTGGLYGTIEQIEADLEYFASLQNRVLAIYASKTGKSPEEIAEIWNPAKYFTAKEAFEYGFIDEVPGYSLERTETAPETPQDENEGEDKPEEDGAILEDSGDKSVIFSLKNVLNKCKELIKRPVVDEYDELADMQNKLTAMAADYEALQMENKTIKEAMEANVAELKNKLDELEAEKTDLYNVIEEQKKNIETTINNEVNNRIAALGYEEEDLIEPSNKIEEFSICDVVRKQGLDAALNILVARKGNKR